MTMKLLFNARIHTCDPLHPAASAILIEGSRILAAGAEDELLGLDLEVTERLDLGGRTILPGLTDAHLHLQNYALGLQKVDCETDTLEECLERVRERVRLSRSGVLLAVAEAVAGGWPATGEKLRLLRVFNERVG